MRILIKIIAYYPLQPVNKSVKRSFLRQKAPLNSSVPALNTDFSPPAVFLLDGSTVGARSLQDLLHFPNGDHRLIVAYRIDLFETFEPLCHVLNALHPIQGCFSNIVSGDMKDR